MAALLFSSCLFLLITGSWGQRCGQTLLAPKVINGVDTRPCTVPWHVQIHFVDDNTVTPYTLTPRSMACSGVILDESHIMTQAGCLLLYARDVTQILETMVVTVGDNDVTVTEGTEQMLTPSEIYFQDEYLLRNQSTLLANVDFATSNFKAYRDYQSTVVKLKTNITFDSCVSNICLPKAGINLCAFKNCKFTGNGLLSSSFPPQRTNITQLVALTALPSDVCATLEAQGYSMATVLGLCAKSEGTGAPCINDSGGPLVCYDEVEQAYFLRGIAVPDSCDPTVASMFEDTSLVLNFIDRATKGQITAAI